MEDKSMNEYENSSFTPEQQQPVPPPQSESPVQQSSAYHGAGAGRKESPYANAPYVMEHQSRTEETHYSYQLDCCFRLNKHEYR